MVTPRSHRTGIALGLLCAATLGVAAWGLRGLPVHGARPEPTPEPASPAEDLHARGPSSPGERQSAADPAPAAQALEGRVSAPTPRPDGRTIDPRDYPDAATLLEHYWGSDWPAVRAELVAAGLDLDTYPLEQMPTWDQLRAPLSETLLASIDEERRKAHEDRSRWASLESALTQVVPDGELPPGVDRELAERHLRDLNARIDEVVENLYSGLEVTLMDGIDRPDVATVHPIGFPRETLGWEPVPSANCIWLQSLAIDGWVIEYQVLHHQEPTYSVWNEDRSRLEAERERFLRELVAG